MEEEKNNFLRFHEMIIYYNIFKHLKKHRELFRATMKREQSKNKHRSSIKLCHPRNEGQKSSNEKVNFFIESQQKIFGEFFIFFSALFLPQVEIKNKTL